MSRIPVDALAAAKNAVATFRGPRGENLVWESGLTFIDSDIERLARRVIDRLVDDGYYIDLVT